MAGDLIFGTFSPSDKVPGAYGAVQAGVSGQSAASLPVLLLLVGLKLAGGTMAADTQVLQVFQPTDLDTYAGAGSELACMGYDAIATAPNTPVWIASPTPPNGAVSATSTILVTGAWTTTGTMAIRFGGQTIYVQVGSADNIATVCTNIATFINGQNSGRLKVSATATATTVVVVDRTPGVRGNQTTMFVDLTSAPAGFGATATGPIWTLTTAFTTSQYVVPTVSNGYYYKCTTAGTTNSTQPTWPTTVGTTVTDGTVVWTCWGLVIANNTVVGNTLGGGSGLESYTNLLATLFNKKFDRIALAANDATSDGAWKTQIDQQATINFNIPQQVVVALNSTQTAAQTLGQTTLNDTLFQVLFLQNGETHPSRHAASFAAFRALSEASDPAASYDGTSLATVAPQSQPGDIPSHAQLVAMLNASVTPFSTQQQQAVCIRSICTHSLTNSASDYSTLDTYQVTVPYFVLLDARLYWSSVFANPKTGNTRIRGPLAPTEKKPRSGVATPDIWNAAVLRRLNDMEDAKNPGTCDPILFGTRIPQNAPTTLWDNTNKRYLTSIITNPAPAPHQVEIAVLQAS